VRARQRRLHHGAGSQLAQVADGQRVHGPDVVVHRAPLGHAHHHEAWLEGLEARGDAAEVGRLLAQGQREELLPEGQTGELPVLLEQAIVGVGGRVVGMTRMIF
jgi:hypothetical protein